MGKQLLSLEDAFSSGELGNKAVSLGNLLRDGLPVPRGVVIPDRALQAHLVRCGIAEDVGALLDGLDRLGRDEIRDTSRRIRERIEVTPLHQALRDELASHHASHWFGKVLAVRSSAAAEDSLQASFAGQLDSFLRINSVEEIETAVRRTWASLWSERSLLYARQKGLRPRCMGVILQEQVDARLSGVLFTRDPLDEQSDWMLAEYCSGLGEALVSGAMTPSSLRIARHHLELQAAPQSGTGLDLDPVYRRGLQAIARMALEIEARGATPQDIEWSIDGNGAPWLLQARPISMTARQQVPAPVQVHWSNANIAENFPEPVSPFLYSLVKPGYTAYFRNLALGFGLSRERVRRMSDALEDLVGLHAGRLYYNLTNIHTVLRLAPGGRWLVRSFNLFVGAAEIPETSLAAMGRVERLREALRILARTTWQYLWIQRRVQSFERRVDEFARETQPDLLPEKSTGELRRDLQRFLEIRLAQWNDAALADAAAMVCYGLLKAQLASNLGAGDDVGLHNDLLKGLPGLASSEPVMKLWELAQGLRDDPDLQALFEENDVETIFARLGEPGGRGFRARLDTYLDRWGFRSSGELMLTTPTPHENPLPVLRLLQAYLRETTTSPDAMSRKQAAAREATTAAVAARLTGWRPGHALFPLTRASRFLALLRATQGAIKLRERARMKQALLYTRLRHVALAIGDRLVQRGLFSDRADVFFLTTTEVDDLLADAVLDGESAAARVATRRAEFERFRTQTPPDCLALAPGEQWSAAAGENPATGVQTGDYLRGNSACGGVATGTAAVVLDVAEADRLEAGQILVTRQTDPGWAAVFFLTSGLVIERGGMLSHGAIIAREYGIPAVVGVPDATRLIGNGDKLRVDGDHGIVQLIRS
jgi:phosphohistidine swiveling domain-containing protein